MVIASFDWAADDGYRGRHDGRHIAQGVQPNAVAVGNGRGGVDLADQISRFVKDQVQFTINDEPLFAANIATVRVTFLEVGHESPALHVQRLIGRNDPHDGHVFARLVVVDRPVNGQVRSHRTDSARIGQVMRERKAKQRLLGALLKQFRRFHLLSGGNHHSGRARTSQNYEKRKLNKRPTVQQR